jgi:hypothetical protein
MHYFWSKMHPLHVPIVWIRYLLSISARRGQVFPQQLGARSQRPTRRKPGHGIKVMLLHGQDKITLQGVPQLDGTRPYAPERQLLRGRQPEYAGVRRAAGLANTATGGAHLNLARQPLYLEALAEHGFG